MRYSRLCVSSQMGFLFLLGNIDALFNLYTSNISGDFVMSKTIYRSTHVRTLVATGVFSALAYVCCVLFHFKAGFLSFDLKDAVMTVAAMLFGPSYGLAMSIVVSTIESLTIGSTGVYGFVMDILSSCTFICIGSFIYSRKRNMIGALLGMLLSIVCMTAVMMAANLLITPFYMGVSTADVAAMIPTLLLPFNLTKAVFNASLVFLLYKPISRALRLAGFETMSKRATTDGVVMTVHTPSHAKYSSILGALAAILMGLLALLYFFVVLSGSFSLI